MQIGKNHLIREKTQIEEWNWVAEALHQWSICWHHGSHIPDMKDDRGEVYEGMKSDSEEDFEATYEADEKDENGDVGSEAIIKNVVVSPAVSQPMDVSPFMRNLDLDTIYVPKFPEYTNIGVVDLEEGEFRIGMEYSSRKSIVEAIRSYTISRGVDYTVYKSEPQTFYAKCKMYSHGCDWLIRTSLIRKKVVVVAVDGNKEMVEILHTKEIVVAKAVAEVVVEKLPLTISVILRINPSINHASIHPARPPFATDNHRQQLRDHHRPSPPPRRRTSLRPPLIRHPQPSTAAATTTGRARLLVAEHLLYAYEWRGWSLERSWEVFTKTGELTVFKNPNRFASSNWSQDQITCIIGANWFERGGFHQNRETGELTVFKNPDRFASSNRSQDQITCIIGANWFELGGFHQNRETDSFQKPGPSQSSQPLTLTGLCSPLSRRCSPLTLDGLYSPLAGSSSRLRVCCSAHLRLSPSLPRLVTRLSLQCSLTCLHLLCCDLGSASAV
ncbi:hypothetical protein Ahy_A05g022647 isoform A [Arachis hypogaea]|uniref:Transposase MuDR plant domain-containing protein n=1 Tax=Arachis hypogaea TaxID=3818 RepID=A0A445D137_ARAHY|nr:hypothetical protein Ahy_A05g022647 isoform A [Arachis hypogaea]